MQLPTFVNEGEEEKQGVLFSYIPKHVIHRARDVREKEVKLPHQNRAVPYNSRKLSQATTHRARKTRQNRHKSVQRKADLVKGVASLNIRFVGKLTEKCIGNGTRLTR